MKKTEAKEFVALEKSLRKDEILTYITDGYSARVDRYAQEVIHDGMILRSIDYLFEDQSKLRLTITTNSENYYIRHFIREL